MDFYIPGLIREELRRKERKEVRRHKLGIRKTSSRGLGNDGMKENCGKRGKGVNEYM